MNITQSMMRCTLIVLASTLISGIFSAPAQAAPANEASITITGNPVAGRHYRAYRIADYINVVVRNGKPVGSELATAATGINISSTVFCDGTTGSNLDFKQALGKQVSCIEDRRNGSDPAPTVAADGSVDNQDPLVWATTQWQKGVNASTSDPWLNTNAQAAGPLRSLADWLYAVLTEDPGCTAGTDESCFGMPSVYEEEGSQRDDGGNAAQVQFTNIDPGLYLVYQLDPDPSNESADAVTTVPAMIVGTKIPVAGELYDMYNVTGTQVYHELGVLNAKGDEVAIAIEIDDPYKRAHPTFGIGETVPYIVTATLPNFDGFAREGGNGSYSGGVLPANAVIPRSGLAVQPRSAVFSGESPSVFLTEETGTLNPVRFEVSIDYSAAFSNPDANGSVAGLADMQVTVASTLLHYSASCVLGSANTADPCFAYRQGTPNAAGETRVLVQIPSWVLRANGDGSVVITYEQQVLHTISDDDASPLEAFDEVDGGPGSEDWSVASASFSTDPYGADYTDFSAQRSHATARAREISVFTFPLVITKIDSQSNVTLPGAEFTIKQDGELECFTLRNGVYVRSSRAPCQSPSTGRLVADSSGRLQVKGLEAHVDYQVLESKQPEGYDPGNVRMVDFTVRVDPIYNSDSRPTEVLATEYIYEGASYLHSRGLPSYLRPATTEWVNNVDHVKHTYYAHEIDVLNGKTGKDVDAIAPFPWGVLAKTGAGVLGFLLFAGLLLLLGLLLKRRREEGEQCEPIEGVRV